MDLDAFARFIHQRNGDLKKIARATQGEQQYDDVVNTSWLMAADISNRLGCPVDFADTAFQSLLISHLYQALVRYTELNVRRAIRLDHAAGGDTEEGEPHWLMNRLSGDDGHDPLSHLLAGEAKNGRIEDGEDHPSLAGAWLALLRMHGNRMPSVARRLLVSISHAYRCHAKACWLAEMQCPIPFDARELTSRLGPWRHERAIRAPKQMAFDFDEELPLRHV